MMNDIIIINNNSMKIGYNQHYHQTQQSIHPVDKTNPGTYLLFSVHAYYRMDRIDNPYVHDLIVF